MSLLSWKTIRPKRLFIVIIVLIVFGLIVVRRTNFEASEHPSDSEKAQSNKPRLAVLVPFRDRFDELIAFVPNLSEFLKTQDIGPFRIHILNQSRRYRFNRGALANVGYLLARNQSDYIAIHDVDLIPLNKNLSYTFPEKGPYHLSSPQYHPQYNYEKYFGGILLIRNDHFEMVNGMSNRYFGWGLEDDEFYLRIKSVNLPVSRPENLTTTRNNTFLHFHYNRKRDVFKTKEQRELLRRRDKITGLRDLKYSVTALHNITIDEQYNCTIANIEIHCDTRQTPWCLHSYVQQQINS